jgi:hypothetical protein
MMVESLYRKLGSKTALVFDDIPDIRAGSGVSTE